jgi:hypothetical protein
LQSAYCRRGKNPPLRLLKIQKKIIKNKKAIRSKLLVGSMEKEITSLIKKKHKSIASSISPIYMPESARPRRRTTLRRLTETHKRQM